MDAFANFKVIYETTKIDWTIIINKFINLK